MTDKYEPDSIETIDIPDEELFGIPKLNRSLDFPAITIGKDSRSIFFNKAALPFLPTYYVRIFATTNYIVFIPCADGAADGFKLNKEKKKLAGALMRMPASLSELKLMEGTFRLMKYKNGICYKRYEPLGKEDANG